MQLNYVQLEYKATRKSPRVSIGFDDLGKSLARSGGATRQRQNLVKPNLCGECVYASATAGLSVRRQKKSKGACEGQRSRKKSNQ